MKYEENRRGKWIWKAFVLLFGAVFVVSLAGAGRTILVLRQEKNAFSDLSQLVEEKTVTETAEETKEPPLEEENPYQELAALNPDFAGWLKIEGMKVDYPVMHTPEDMQYYIRRDFYGNPSVSGTPFIGDYCDKNSQSIIIYAHNMKNGTMFGDLNRYQKQSWWREHPVVEFNTAEENREYEIFAAFYTELPTSPDTGFAYYSYVGDLSEERFYEFTDQVSQRACYDTGIIPEYGDRLLILSTCSYHTENGRFVVAAREKSISQE